MLEHCCDPLIWGKDASGTQGEGKQFSVWISLLTAGEHGGGYSMEGDGLRAEGELLVLFVFCREQLENRVLETALVFLCSTRENHEEGEYDVMVCGHVCVFLRMMPFCL